MKKIKIRIFDIIQAAHEGDKMSRLFDFFIIGLIILNVSIIIIGTFPISAASTHVFHNIELFSITIFTIEYLLRLWTADLLYPNRGPITSRLRYMISFMALIDLLAILPFYLPFLIPIDLRALRTLRTIRLLRLFKVNRYTKALSAIGEIFKEKASQLISSIFVVFLLMVITSILMYNVENPAQPEVFNNAFSGFWWAIATLTTVGYGDIYPITVVGKLLSSVVALLGIGLIAVPTGIISSGFMEHIEKNRGSNEESKHYCPYCGKRLDDD